MTEPKLRFSQYNDRVITVLLHDIFKKITRKNKGNLITNVITNSAKEGLVPQREYFDKDVANKENTEGYYIIEEGDFVYNPRKSAEAPYGPFGRYNFSSEGIVSPLYTCLKLIDKNEINSDFLLYYFKSPAWYRYVYANGDTGVRHDRVSIKDDTLLDMPIHIPDKDEQIKVVQLFKSIDDVIDVLKSDVLLWEEKKKGVMQKIFSQEVRFKKKDGSDYSEWEKRKLEEVVVFLDGKRKPLEGKQRVSGIYPYYGASGIIDYVEDYIFDEENILLSEDGANIINRTYRVSFLARGKYWVNNHAHVLHPKNDNSAIFICEQLESLDYGKYNSGSAQPKLNQEVCRKIPIIMPCLEEQRRIADFLSSIDEVIQIKKQKLEVWKNIKKGLLQRMFA